MPVRLDAISESSLAEAVAAFNMRYGEMERVLWCLSQHCRESLIHQEPSPMLETLVWTIKSWWGVQGVRTQTRTAMARALTEVKWSTDDFAPAPVFTPGACAPAVELVAEVVARTQAHGTQRREYSLASKVLHWLLPWRVAVYDSFVRQSLGVPASWDHPVAYERIVRELFDAAERLLAHDASWLGTLEPRSPLRAFDKVLWWLGGGDAATAAEVRNPWRVIDQLGLKRL